MSQCRSRSRIRRRSERSLLRRAGEAHHKRLAARFRLRRFPRGDGDWSGGLQATELPKPATRGFVGLEADAPSTTSLRCLRFNQFAVRSLGWPARSTFGITLTVQAKGPSQNLRDPTRQRNCLNATDLRPRAVAISPPGASGWVRLAVVEIELPTPMAIERLVRNVVTADINIAAKRTSARVADANKPKAKMQANKLCRDISIESLGSAGRILAATVLGPTMNRKSSIAHQMRRL